MKLSIGIVGLPNVGKSTLFKILTKAQVNIANYPFCTIDPNVGVVPVPDERLDKLDEFSKSAKKIPAVVEFYDIAGLVKGANRGEGLGNQFLSHIRETKAIVMVLRVFQDSNIIHIEKSVDPVRDMDTVLTELAFKDLETIEKVWKKWEGEVKTGGKESENKFSALKSARAALEAGEMLNTRRHPYILENVRMSELNLLSAKKQLFLLNGKEEDVNDELKKKIAGFGAEYIVADLGKTEDIPELIRAAYRILNLISFFTTGEDETRAWTIERGTRAPQAAGVIHTDFQEKFIRAEVIYWEKLIACGGWVQAKNKGLLRLEGKEYEVKDGDVMVIRHG